MQRLIGEPVPLDTGFLLLSDQRGFHLDLVGGKVLKFVCWQRAGKVIALHNITAHALERHELLSGLHALCDGGQLQRLGQLDHSLQKPCVLALLEGRADKLHVQLQRINRQL